MKPNSKSDDDYYDRLTHYNTTAAANTEELGLIEEEVGDINTAWTAFKDARIAE